MASVTTPIGRLQWEGTLNESTNVSVITLRNGAEDVRESPLSTLIAMTNGAILEYLPDPSQVTPEAPSAGLDPSL